MPDILPDMQPGVIYDLREAVDDKSIKIAEEEFEFVESVRKEKYASYLKRRKIATFLIPIMTPLLGWFDWFLITVQRNGGNDAIAGLSVLFLGALWGWVRSPKRKYRKTYKKIFMPKIVKALGNFKYDVKGKISESLLAPSKIIPVYDRYTSEDYFEGHYKNTHIRFSEIELAVRKKNKDRTYYETVFKGLAILFEKPNKKFYGHTIIDQNSSSMMEWFKEKAHGLKRANLVDPIFEEKFDVYTNDQVEARYLIHPQIIERLTDLSDHYHGNKLTAAFYDNKFLIMISSKHNHFEPADISIPATSKESLYHLKQEIEDILAIGDRLELYSDQQIPH